MCKTQRLMYQNILKEHAILLADKDRAASQVIALRNILMQVCSFLLLSHALRFLHTSALSWPYPKATDKSSGKCAFPRSNVQGQTFYLYLPASHSCANVPTTRTFFQMLKSEACLMKKRYVADSGWLPARRSRPRGLGCIQSFILDIFVFAYLCRYKTW